MTKTESDVDQFAKGAEFDRAWQYVLCADQILHSRIASLLTAESFLIGAVAVLLATKPDKSGSLIEIVEFMIVLTAISVTWVFRNRNISIANRMEKLRDEYLIKLDPVYRMYIGAVPRQSERLRLHSSVPEIFLVFWLVLLVILIARFFFPLLDK